MNTNNYYPNPNPVPEGKTRFIITYQGFGVNFKTEVDEVDQTDAIIYFKKFYPSAKFISIAKKKI